MQQFNVVKLAIPITVLIIINAVCFFSENNAILYFYKHE